MHLHTREHGRTQTHSPPPLSHFVFVYCPGTEGEERHTHTHNTHTCTHTRTHAHTRTRTRAHTHTHTNATSRPPHLGLREGPVLAHVKLEHAPTLVLSQVDTVKAWWGGGGVGEGGGVGGGVRGF